MKIIWNDNSLRWFHEASEYTGYNRTLAKLLMELIPHRGTLCDMGCGAALIDYELAPHFQHITCVDISPEAIASVDKNIKERHFSNMEAVCVDGSSYSGSSDTVIALFHGGPDVFENYYHLAKEQLIIITHVGKSGTFGPKKYQKKHCIGAEKTIEHLEQLGVKYKYMEQSLEYGQPFENLEDAMTFVDAYCAPSMTAEEKRKHLESRLIETGEKNYPYYMPNKKEMGIFIINKKDNTQIGV